MELVDTMIVSYGWKAVPGYEIKGRSISSVTAQEFLLVHTEDLKRARYYLPRLHHSGMGGLYAVLRAGGAKLSKGYLKPHPSWRDRTDRLFIDFASEYPTIIEYGHQRLAGAINGGEIRYYETCIGGLDRRLRRDLLARFVYMVENQVKCVALSSEIIERMFALLAAFSQTNNPKAKFRNTINDLLILATALERQARLFTRDTVLNRFAANFYEAPFEKVDRDIWSIDFGGSIPDRRKPYESKGYINRSWQIIERRA